MALFTSDSLGFGKGDSGDGDGGLSALPMAVGCVSPFSVALLWFYAVTLDAGGPCRALRTHTLICAGTQIVAGWILKELDSYLEAGEGAWARACSAPLLFALFVFQNAYVQLLYNQHWAFIGSVLTAEEGKRAFAPIAGLGSIGSTVAAGLVSALVGWVGLIRLFHVAGVSYVFSAILADAAFGTARAGGFEPRGVPARYGGTESGKSKRKDAVTEKFAGNGGYAPINGSNIYETTSPTTCAPCAKKGSVFQQARSLFQRHPVLGALFLETIISQCLSSLVNFIYLCTLKTAIADDGARAGWSGNFYAWVNGVSGVFQFLALPVLLERVEARRIWPFMPSVMLCCTACTLAIFPSADLRGASASFFAMKTMEYSLRVAANEALYVSLDYDSRYLGKKVISLIAGKFGKSAMAVVLSLVMFAYGDRPDTMWYLMATTGMFSLLWLICSMRLHSLIGANK